MADDGPAPIAYRLSLIARSLSLIPIVAKFRMGPADKERGARNAAGVVLSYVEDVSGEATQYAGVQSELQ